jgi:hypothetical protein
MKEQVIEERKETLAKYMNELVLTFNIFSDPDVTAFIAIKNNDKMRAHLKSLFDY